ncbi:DUF2637 domain-containing protein [Microbacterium lacticum]
MTAGAPAQGGRLAVVTAVAGTVLIACGAFWLSFTALADLARRSGIDRGQAWAWPLIVDGVIVVATVAVVALAGHRGAWYPWMLLLVGAGLSVTANSIHAVVAADADVAPVLAASVAAVPPLVLLAITHLTVILTRHRRDLAEPRANDQSKPRGIDLTVIPSDSISFAKPVESALRPPPVPPITAPPTPRTSRLAQSNGRERAARLRDEGWSNKKIARELGVHPSTVGRWLPQPDPGAGSEAAGSPSNEYAEKEARS